MMPANIWRYFSGIFFRKQLRLKLIIQSRKEPAPIIDDAIISGVEVRYIIEPLKSASRLVATPIINVVLKSSFFDFTSVWPPSKTASFMILSPSRVKTANTSK